MFKFGDAVRVIEQAGAEPVLGFVTKVEGNVVNIVKVVKGAVTEVENILGHPTLAAAQAEGAGEHAVHTVAPLEDVTPVEAPVESVSTVLDAPAAPAAPVIPVQEPAII